MLVWPVAPTTWRRLAPWAVRSTKFNWGGGNRGEWRTQGALMPAVRSKPQQWRPPRPTIGAWRELLATGSMRLVMLLVSQAMILGGEPLTTSSNVLKLLPAVSR